MTSVTAPTAFQAIKRAEQTFPSTLQPVPVRGMRRDTNCTSCSGVGGGDAAPSNLRMVGPKIKHTHKCRGSSTTPRKRRRRTDSYHGSGPETSVSHLEEETLPSELTENSGQPTTIEGSGLAQPQTSVSPTPVFVDATLNTVADDEASWGATSCTTNSTNTPGEPTEEEQEVDRRFECPICYSTYTRPVKLSCNHRYCDECITHALTLNTSCPLCRTVSGECVPDEQVRAEMSSLLRLCPGKCGEVVTLLEREEHLKYTCPAIVCTCEFFPYGCEYEGARREHKQHSTVCSLEPLRPFFPKIVDMENRLKKVQDRLAVNGGVLRDLTLYGRQLATQQNVESRILRRELTAVMRHTNLDRKASRAHKAQIYFQWRLDQSSRVGVSLLMSSPLAAAFKWYCGKKRKSLSAFSFFTDSVRHGTRIKAEDTLFDLGMRTLDVIYVDFNTDFNE